MSPPVKWGHNNNDRGSAYPRGREEVSSWEKMLQNRDALWWGFSLEQLVPALLFDGLKQG